MLCVVGSLLGIGLGALSSSLASSSGIWLEFSYFFVSPLVAELSAPDIIFILAFMLASVSVWIYLPLIRLIRQRPFSY